MEKSLVIVESPAKARTINRYLGSKYLVRASMGHVCDLPKSELGVDLNNNFEPTYIILPKRRSLIKNLQRLAAECHEIFLAADPDREGEAICWHLSRLLEKFNPRIRRVLLYEITKKAVEEAFSHPASLDGNKIKAQQTRRILDRLVGYLISPLLWEKIGHGLSAGRVQSVALRLICEREKEIRNFVPEEYWTITALLEASEPPAFKASLEKIDGKKVKLPTKIKADEILAELKNQTFVIKEIKIEEKKKNPPPPYITSTLQQEAFRLLHFPVTKTMAIAQRLYEGLPLGERGPVGLITYMRTDSVRISPVALKWARSLVEKNFGRDFLPPKARIFKNKSQAQDAHEAIRPTSPELSPEMVKPYLKKDEYELYRLIWHRFLASQMAAALLEVTEFRIEAGRYEFKAKGQVLKFPGFLKLYPEVLDKDEILPKAKKGETLKLLDLEAKQNFTQPPPRYTEGSLVRELEAKGIGRPSTYAPIIATLQDRVYVIKDKGKFFPTDLGMFVTDFLVEHFPDLMDVKFTAQMEAELDKISQGEKEWLEALRKFYELLKKDLEKGKEAEGVKGKGIPTEEKCPLCGQSLVIREGRYGRFKACSAYPSCQYKESLRKKEARQLEEKCPQCGSTLVSRKGPYGYFVACSNFPRCDYKKNSESTGLSCPLNCGGQVLKRRTKRGKIFYGCSHYPSCQFATWDEPTEKLCPLCHSSVLWRKKGKGRKTQEYCLGKDCGYKVEVSKKREMDKKDKKLEEGIKAGVEEK
ncbi:MAG: type I DNA topoisomerase [Candidatus Aminicenantes bacterium]|nr:type I DNA topoisomerase [Candidatus Aminicenantes bacterium]